jgi:hypothetical protein
MLAMIRLRPTAEQVARAMQREAAMTERVLERHGREYLNNSIREGEGVLIGLLGEEISHDLYPGMIPSTGDDIYDYDLRDPRHLGSIDVKTKRCTSAPKAHYWCTVCDANIKQQCDYYCFVRIMEDFSVAWVIGFMPKAEFLRRSTFFRKGEFDPTSQRDWQFSWDCHNLAADELWAPPRDADGLVYLENRRKLLLPSGAGELWVPPGLVAAQTIA